MHRGGGGGEEGRAFGGGGLWCVGEGGEVGGNVEGWREWGVEWTIVGCGCVVGMVGMVVVVVVGMIVVVGYCCCCCGYDCC